MSEWTFINHNQLKHQSGFKLELLSGTWREPEDLNPQGVPGASVAETAGLMRLGLQYASENGTLPKAETAKIKRLPRKAPGPRTLSLKRKKDSA